MSREYDLYLEQHKGNVAKGFHWMQENLPNVVAMVKMECDDVDLEHQICFAHDFSKEDPEEYEAYDKYFYGGAAGKSYAGVQAFNHAWLRHIHHNPHHWQHWILINDDPGEGEIILEMPLNYILEMILDWWAFSWNSGNLFEIFDWYDKHKDYMKLGEGTRIAVEDILATMRMKLED